MCVYLCESTWCSVSQTMADEDLMVAPQTSLAGSSSLPVEASAREVLQPARKRLKTYASAFKLRVITFAAFDVLVSH